MKYRDSEENRAKTTRYSSAAAHGKRDDERVKCLARVQPDGPRGEGVKAKRVHSIANPRVLVNKRQLIEFSL